MNAVHRGPIAWLALLIVLFVIVLAAPLAASAAPKLSAAPLSPEFLRYQADLEVRQAVGLDRIPGFRPGLVPEPMVPPASSSGRRATAGRAYASSFSLGDVGKLSPVKNQGELGACWTFATMASLESCLLPGELRDFSEDNVVLNSGFDTGSTPAEKYDHGGNYYMSTAYLIRWSGPVDESEDAYGDSSSPSGLTPQKHVQEVLYIPGGDPANIKYALTTWGAVGTSIEWEDGYYNGATSSFYDWGSGSINHAVTIVGWDDAYSAANFAKAPPGPGAWLVKNSWGDGWGQSGYFWVSYYDRFCATSDVYNAVYRGVEATTNYDTIYSYDPLGECDSVGYGTDTAWGANVFTAGQSQSIAAVGFFTDVQNATYTVYAGASLSSLQALGSGTESMPGFHTVPLSSPLSVTGGSSFAVAVRLTEPGQSYPIAVENVVPSFSSAATASPGQSFVSRDGSSWSDLTTAYDSTANVCLKAYATTSSAPPAVDTVGPVCDARNARVRSGRICKLYLRVYDALSEQVTKRLVITTRAGRVKKRISTGYADNYDGWWVVKNWRCRLPRGVYRIVVTGKDLAGNEASVVGRAKLRVL
jgi:C1A family cysteine protease